MSQSQPVDQSLIISEVGNLVGSNYYLPMIHGMRFETDAEGKLIPIPRENMRTLVGELKRFAQAEDWWLGDTANAILGLFGEDEFLWFCEQIQKDPTYVKKKVSVSRRFGAPHVKVSKKDGTVTVYPDRINELRHPELSQSHHDIVQGVKDDGQRMTLLNDAAREFMGTSAFHEHVKAWKAGPGAEQEEEGQTDEEYPVFKSTHRAYNPKVDNDEQFLAEFFEKIKIQDFPEYKDPNLRKARELKETKEKLADKLPADLKTKVLTEHFDLELASFEALVNKLLAANEERTKIEKFLTKKIKDETLRASLLERAKSESLLFDAVKDLAKKEKDAASQRKKDEGKIEKLITSIEDEAKRSEIFTVVAEQKLGFDQVKAMVNPILTDQILDKDTKKIQLEAASKIQKRADELREKSLADKADKKKVAESDLPLAKGGKKKKPQSKPAAEQPVGD